MLRFNMSRELLCLLLALSVIMPNVLGAQEEEEFTSDFYCENWCTTGSNPFFPLWPGHELRLEGEEEDDEGDLVDISAIFTVLPETELVNGIWTRVFEERESEDGELVEVSRNFVAICRETGDIWYFGEDVDDYEDGEIVGHEGAWRAGVDGAEPGILMPGSPMLGARYFEEVAPGVALDQGEIVSLGEEVTVPYGTFGDTLETRGTSALDPDADDEKIYARGVGNIVDEALELVEIVPPPCQPDATTHCLNNGRFRVEVEWEDFAGGEGPGNAILPCDISGEFWFFSPSNTELMVKVIDGCDHSSNSFWVFAAGLTNVEVTLTVTDTQTEQVRVYENDLGADFEPVLDIQAFQTCP